MKKWLWLFRPIASLQLTLVLLFCSLILVFLGTMAQEPLGLYLAQARFFQSGFVDLASMTAAIKKTLQMFHVYLPPSTAADVVQAPFVPVFPGGYLLGSALLLNLLAAHAVRFRFTWKKSGILSVHAGLIVLLVGQLCTDLVARESGMRLTEGQTRNYSESDRRCELAIIDTTDAAKDRVVSIPEDQLATGASFRVPELPFTVRLLRYYPNSFITNLTAVPDAPKVTEGPGTRFAALERPRVTVMDLRDVPSVVVELAGSDGKMIGSYLLSEYLDRAQPVEHGGRTYELSLRPRRFYKDFSLTLLDFRHDKYMGTDIPKNFSSQVRLQNPKTGEDREVLIYMNNPLRYQGMTFYQASFDRTDERVTILQVVRNPAWATPYFACLIVGAGLLLQFGIHLVGFIRRKATGTVAGSPAVAA